MHVIQVIQVIERLPFSGSILRQAIFMRNSPSLISILASVDVKQYGHEKQVIERLPVPESILRKAIFMRNRSFQWEYFKKGHLK